MKNYLFALIGLLTLTGCSMRHYEGESEADYQYRRAMQRQAFAQAWGNSFSGMGRVQPTEQVSAPINCTTTQIGRQIYTNCN